MQLHALLLNLKLNLDVVKPCNQKRTLPLTISDWNQTEGVHQPRGDDYDLFLSCRLEKYSSVCIHHKKWSSHDNRRRRMR